MGSWAQIPAREITRSTIPPRKRCRVAGNNQQRDVGMTFNSSSRLRTHVAWAARAIVKSLAANFPMAMVPKQSTAEVPSSKPEAGKIPDIVSASVPETLATLRVNPGIGLNRTEIEARRKEYGYNEVAETKEHPILRFLSKFWGLSAWMLELIIMLSAVLRKFSDLAVVSALFRKRWAALLM